MQLLNDLFKTPNQKITEILLFLYRNLFSHVQMVSRFHSFMVQTLNLLDRHALQRLKAQIIQKN